MPLESPIDATAGGSAVKIVELSAIGCKIEHRDKISMGGLTTLRFKWGETDVEMRAKAMRTELRSGMVFQTGLKFADSLESAPLVMREIVAALAKEELPPEIAPEIAPEIVPEVVEVPTEVAEPEVAAESPAELDVETDEEVLPEVELDLLDEPAEQPVYIECTLEDGRWQRRRVSAVLQPAAEGFITIPDDDSELDMLCKTYEYADPDTRRLIRISLELTATRKRD